MLDPPSFSVRHGLVNLAAQSTALGIVDRLQPHGRGAHLAQNVNLELLALARQRAGHIAGGEAGTDAMAVGARGHVADRGSVLEQRLIADDVGIPGGDLHDHEPARRSGRALGEGGGAPGKIGLADPVSKYIPSFAGMKVGGKRQLRIPPDLAYGKGGYSTVIPPNSTLIFDVRLVDVK